MKGGLLLRGPPSISHGELIHETSITQLLYVHKEHSLLLTRPLKNIFTASYRSKALKTPGLVKQ
jgi:hypothetical protein